MNRTAIFLFVAAIALAGCSGGPLGGKTTSTTPTATPPAPPVDEAPYPDGASSDGLDAETVASGNKEALRDAGSYSLTWDYREENGEFTRSTSWVADVDVAADVINSTTNRTIRGPSYEDQGPQVYDKYNDNETSITRTRRESGDSYIRNRLSSTYSARQTTSQISNQLIKISINQFHFNATATERRNGTVLITYESTDVNNTNAGAGILPGTELAPNSSATLVLDESGVVRSLSWTANGTHGQEQLMASLSISDIGSTTVERPEWADTAIEETTPLPVSAPQSSFDISQRPMTLSTDRESARVPVVEFHLRGGDTLETANLEIRVLRKGGGVRQGYDVTSLQPEDGRLKSTNPLPDYDVMEPPDTIRVVHVVPEDHHDSLRLDHERGAITAGDGAVENGQLRPGDIVVLRWTGQQGSTVIAKHEIE